MRVIELSRSRLSRSLGAASKLNRDPRFIEELMSHGESRAGEFLAALAFEDAWGSRDLDAMTDFFVEDAEITTLAPFSRYGTYRGKREVRKFVSEHLAKEVRVDLTKKQVAQNRVAWTVRMLRGDETSDRLEGVAEAELRGRKIKALRLYSEG